VRGSGARRDRTPRVDLSEHPHQIHGDLNFVPKTGQFSY
jgi:hypothetical protein